MKLNLGCGRDIREGYVNIDIAPSDPLVTVGDVRALQYDPGSVEEIIAQDVLEHLFPVEGPAAIRHWFSLLTPHGKIRIRVPDIFAQSRLLLAGTWDSRTFTRMVYAGQTDPDRHRTGYTLDRLTGLMEGAGFTITHTEYEQRGLDVDPTISCNANIVVEAERP